MSLSKALLSFWLFFVITSMVLMSQILQASEQQTKNLQKVHADNLPEFVGQLSSDYYQQLESLLNFYQLYQQKRDPRGFNVWHLRGFSPVYQERQAYYRYLHDNTSPASKTKVKSMLDIFEALETISTQLMVSFRENDPAAYQQAKTLIRGSNSQLATHLNQYQLSSEIRDINLP